jgi:TonB family protein
VDPVSEMLTERERVQQRLLPFFIIAISLHGAAAATVFFAARTGHVRPAQLPGVSVRLVRPAAGPAKAAAGPPAREEVRRPSPPSPKPQPSPRPKGKATPPPKSGNTQAKAPAASERALAAPRSSVTPAPEPPTGGGTGGRGLSLDAGSSGGGIPGIPADFQFTFYVERMLALIESSWFRPPTSGSARARVRFTVTRSGRVEDIQLEESSGIPSFDRAALRALFAANPLPPLPPAYARPSLTIHLSFSE